MNNQSRAAVTESLLNAASALSASAENGRAYVIANLAKLDDMDLNEMERRIKANDLSTRVGMYVSREGTVGNTKLIIDLLKPISELEKLINEKVGSTYGDIDFKAYDRVGGVVRNQYLRHKSGNQYSVTNSGYPLPDILAFIGYIVTNQASDSHAHVYKWMEETGNKQAMYEPSYEIEYEGVKIKKFKNGRLDLVFPKSAQTKKAQETLEQWHAAKLRQ